MRPFQMVGLSVLLALAVRAAAVTAEQTYMELTFDDKTVGEPIGTGGVDVGEPTWFEEQIEAIVRATPFGTPCLEVHNTDIGTTRAMAFLMSGLDFVSSGLAVIAMDLWFEPVGSAASPWFQVLKANWSYLMVIQFDADGAIRVTDPAGSAATLPDFPKSRTLPIRIAFDIDAGTYSVWVDGVQAVTDRAHGVDAPDFKGFTLNTGSGNDPDNRLWIDFLRVTDSLSEVAVKQTTWGRIRASYR